MPITDDAGFTRDEVGLALRNPGMPLEALRRPLTPIGMHYVLIHFDVPELDAAAFELVVDGRVRAPPAPRRRGQRQGSTSPPVCGLRSPASPPCVGLCTQGGEVGGYSRRPCPP